VRARSPAACGARRPGEHHERAHERGRGHDRAPAHVQAPGRVARSPAPARDGDVPLDDRAYFVTPSAALAPIGGPGSCAPRMEKARSAATAIAPPIRMARTSRLFAADTVPGEGLRGGAPVDFAGSLSGR